MTGKAQKTALVTGAAGGIGLATARRLAQDGFHVVMADIDADRLKAAAYSVAGSVETALADLGDATAREGLIDACGPLFALINNAGIFSAKPALELTGDDFRRMYEINTVAVFELCRLAALKMRDTGGGRIINISSRSFLGGTRVAHYAASKGAVVALTRCLSLEFAPYDILVNSVAPGVIDTDILKGWDDDERNKLASYQPLRRIGQPDDVANVVSMLASPHTDYITGQVIVVDGGRSIGSENA